MAGKLTDREVAPSSLDTLSVKRSRKVTRLDDKGQIRKLYAIEVITKRGVRWTYEIDVVSGSVSGLGQNLKIDCH